MTERKEGWYKIKDGEWKVVEWSTTVDNPCWFLEGFVFVDEEFEEIGPLVMELDGTLIGEE